MITPQNTLGFSDSARRGGLAPLAPAARFFCAAWLAWIAVGCSAASDPVDISNISLRTIESSEIGTIVAESDDSLVLVNVWATWCGPCVEEFPHLVKLDREYRDQDFGVVFVSVDEGDADADAKVKRFLARQEVDFESYRHPGMSADFVQAVTPQWSGSLPGSFLFRDGRLIEIWEGGQSYATFERRLLDEF